MAKLKELKEQYPEFNITLFDVISKLDKSSTNKFTPLICKFVTERMSFLDSNEKYRQERILEIKENLSRKNINVSNLSTNEIIILYHFFDIFPSDIFTIFQEFMEFSERGLLNEKDILKYKTLDQIRESVSLANIKLLNKNLEKEIIKEFEDDTWIIVKPLTFEASIKYGASTKWCTTMKHDKHYFAKYWDRGILVYFLNKKTGYKFAGFKALEHDNDFSFWNAADVRIDFLDIEIDDYLYPIVKSIFNGKMTNSQLCSDELRVSVSNDCGYINLDDVQYIGEQEPVPIEEDIQRPTILYYN